LGSSAWTLYASSLSSVVSSDYNYFFHPYVTKHIAYGPSWTRQSFTQWQALSGKDTHSITNWFTQPVGETSRGKIFYNTGPDPQTFDLAARQYLDLDQQPVIGLLTLQPYTSRILVDNGPALLTLKGIIPILKDVKKAAAFTLTADGTGFTPSSVVRWVGSDRPTAFINSTRLTATISAADVSTVGDFPVTVRDPAAAETAPVLFHVVETVFENFMAQVFR
jgi:hypothetical protein